MLAGLLAIVVLGLFAAVIGWAGWIVISPCKPTGNRQIHKRPSTNGHEVREEYGREQQMISGITGWLRMSAAVVFVAVVVMCFLSLAWIVLLWAVNGVNFGIRG